jgi:PKD repeat protein
VAVGRTASAPQNLRAEPGDKKVRLSWELPADTGGFVPQQYNIYRGSDPLFLNFLLYVNTTSYDDTNLTNRATYYYGVSAVNQMGEGPTAAASAIPFKRAPKVQNFAAAASLRTVTLGWKEPPASDAGPVLSYNIYENMSGNLTLVSNTTETVDEFFNVSVGKHTYQVAALTDFCEGELSDESWVMVKNLLPFANFTVEPGIEGPVSTVFTFRSTARDLDGSLASWEWSFGDGRRGEGAVATHNFTSPGIFNVTLSVSDNDGGNASAWLKVKVTLEQTNRPPRITGWFPQSASPRTTVGNAVNFSISAIDDDGDRLSFNWSVNGRAQPGSNRSFFSYKAASAGTCKLRVEVSDGKSGVSREWLLTAAQSGGGGDAASWAAPLAIAVTVVAAGAGAGLFLVTRKRRAAAQPQPLAVGPAGQPQQAPLPPPIAYEPPPPPKEEKPTAEQMALFQRIDETAAGERPVTKAPQTARKPAGPAARPADLPRSSVMVPGPFPEETAAMRSLSSLPRGLPGTLASYSMDELAAVLITAPFAETADGDLIVKIGKRWYFGDPKQPDTYLQQWKPPQQ